MEDRTCSIAGCGKRHEARGWCHTHYTYWRKTGRPNPPSADEKFEALTNKTTDAGCWIWRGAKSAYGYGVMSIGPAGNRTIHKVHRLAYEKAFGPIPADADIDHECHNAAEAAGTCDGGPTCPHRLCINPDHLRAVPRRVNVLAGSGIGARNARKTHCKRGHEFTPENTQTPPSGGRKCRLCRAAYQRKARDRSSR